MNEVIIYIKMGVPDIGQAVTFKVSTLFDNTGLFLTLSERMGVVYFHSQNEASSLYCTVFSQWDCLPRCE